jgi:hypothetical protein
MKQGTIWEIQQFDAKNKLTSTTKSILKEKAVTGNSIKLKIESESFDNKGKTQGKNSYEAGCENGVFSLDMRGNLNQAGMSNFEGMQVTITADNLDFPSDPKAGQLLKSGKFSLDAQMPGMPGGFKMTIEVYNRKVETIESITTPAGTFECVKISYDMKTNMMGEIISKGVEWYCKEVGLVKSESYDSKGKLTSTSLLSVFK